jgi:hypothetical protein
MPIVYTQRTDNDFLYQGDILKDIVFYFLPPEILIIREEETHLKIHDIDSLEDAFSELETIMARGEKRKIIIMSHHCDVRFKDIIQIAPIYPLSELNSSNQGDCRSNRMKNFFYLPSNESVNLEESYVNFSLLTTYPKSLLDISNRITSISEGSLDQLHERLLIYYTRKKLKDISPELPLKDS